MPLNTILAISESIGINDHKVVGQVYSRNLHISASEYVTVQPFQVSMKPMAFLRYSENRGLLSELRVADRIAEQNLNFSSTGWASYVAYQGTMTGTQISSCAWQTNSANKVLVLGSLPSISSSAYIVKKGDFCQVGRYSYIATEDVLRGTAPTVSIPVHRNLIETLTSTVPAVIGEYGTTVSLGGSTYTGITMPVLLAKYPTYSFSPIANDSFIQWDGDFQAYEVVL